ncbi:reverse transcriptase domain-containing protein [Tanacetum coccineum]|uniref:Reverse transcriptase domain-containing protein n=1 Tax=Tanacetum coccineum TaxID=301880 RepID=A0ABQ5A5I2_9ASTR
MAGPEPITPPNEGTTSQNTTKDIIEGHLSALKELLKESSNQNLIKPMLLDFDNIQDVNDDEVQDDVKGKAKVGDEDLSKPFKEIYDGTGDPEDHVGRFMGIGNQGEWPMPVWCRMFQQTLDGKARAWFDKLPPGSINNWGSLQEKFLNRFGMLKAYDKDPIEISKIARRANETLPHFKERWVSDSNAILNVPELMQISSFMSSHKCPELAKRFSDSIPKIVDEMLKRVNDYLRSEEAFYSTELPRGSSNEETHRSEHKFAARVPECHIPYVAPQRPNQEFHRPKAVLTLDSLSSTPQEILATEHQLLLPQPAPLVGVHSKENLNRYYNYHNEKGHITNDCFHLKRQLEIAMESGKLNHLIKDVRQSGKGGQWNNGPQKAKVINMVQSHPLDRKRKTTMTDEKWMNVPIIFPPVPARDLSKEALVVEAEVEGYLVQRIHIDEGASVKIMFEHCFNMLHPSIRSRLVETQTTVFRFSREQVKPLGKIELNVCFGGSGRCRRAIMKFTVIPAPSPYNIILGRLGLKQLRAIPSTIHGMMKFPTPWGVATVVSQTPMVFECRSEGKKQAMEPSKNVRTQEDTNPTKHVLINPAYPEQLGRGLSPEGSTQLKKNLNRNTDIFAREQSDMTGVPKRIIKHSLNAKMLGYHQVQMADEDEEKTAFYTDQGTYCYTKMSIGLKNARATYQRLVDEALQSQIGKNLKVYVDDMVVKSRTEREMLADIVETFDNLRRINMKLNPKKCSFGVTKGKFLVYMATSEGI